LSLDLFGRAAFAQSETAVGDEKPAAKPAPEQHEFDLRESVTGTEVIVYFESGGNVRGRVLEIGEDSLRLKVTGGSLLRTRRNPVGYSEGQDVLMSFAMIRNIDISPPASSNPVNYAVLAAATAFAVLIGVGVVVLSRID
jgi:hypothetical protein